MSPSPCQSCNTLALRPVALSHDGTGEQITVCSRCLRAATRMKADAVAARSRNLLRDYADEHGCEVWDGPGAVYVLPSVLPFATKSPLVSA